MPRSLARPLVSSRPRDSRRRPPSRGIRNPQGDVPCSRPCGQRQRNRCSCYHSHISVMSSEVETSLTISLIFSNWRSLHFGRDDKGISYPSCKKRIGPFLFPHRRDRSVPRTDDRLVRQRQDLFDIISQRVLIRHISAAH